MRLLLSGGLMITAMLALTGCTTAQKAVFVVGAQLGELDLVTTADSAGEALLLHPHRVEIGSNTVLMLRRFHRGNRWAVDDEWFEKLSIELPDLAEGSSMDVSTDAVRVYYSHGYSGFVSKGNGAYSSAVDGTIKIERVSERSALVRLDLTFSLRSPGPFQLKDRALRVEEVLRFRAASLQGLTPWMGRAGDHPSDEAYP